MKGSKISGCRRLQKLYSIHLAWWFNVFGMKGSKTFRMKTGSQIVLNGLGMMLYSLCNATFGGLNRPNAQRFPINFERNVQRLQDEDWFPNCIQRISDDGLKSWEWNSSKTSGWRLVPKLYSADLGWWFKIFGMKCSKTSGWRRVQEFYSLHLGWWFKVFGMKGSKISGWRRLQKLHSIHLAWWFKVFGKKGSNTSAWRRVQKLYSITFGMTV